jgi:myo-inositol-1(or 4)-monophosphatase
LDRPDYGWLSEESADSADRVDCRRVFIVDPIDGTSAYLGGQPWFVVCIALVESGRPVAAAIYAPEVDELYRAVDGGGARCNGSVIAAGDATTLQACRMLGDVKLFKRPCPGTAWPKMQVERRNAIAYRMALVGAGQFDAAVSPGWKHDWDLAAGDLIAREAGAAVTDTQGRRLMFNTVQARNLGMICAAPALHPLILKRTAPIDQLQA